MSFSWTYITRRFILQNYRDVLSVGIITSFFASKFLTYNSKTADNQWTLTRVYTDDETDVKYKERDNKTDAAVKRQKLVRFAREMKEARVNREREMQLDAYNFLNGKSHQIWRETWRPLLTI